MLGGKRGVYIWGVVVLPAQVACCLAVELWHKPAMKHGNKARE